MEPQEQPNQPTQVDVWSVDSILHTGHPARVIGPWPADPTKTLLQLGESGPGLLVAAANVAGRYVVSLPTPLDIEKYGMVSEHGLIAQVYHGEPPAPEGRRMVPVGIVYAGPPCEWAQEQIAKAFGAGARNISHADATEEQRDHVRLATGNPESHATIYIGVTTPGQFDFDDVEAGLDLIADLLETGLFIGALVPEPEQIEQAVSRIGTGELVVLVPPAPPEA
jgi:hypothetical protein